MKRFSYLFILVLAVAAFGQEGMNAPAAAVPDSAVVDTMAMDEMMMDQPAEAMEETPLESGDALEAMLAEEGTMESEVTSGSALIGYTVGLNVGYPIYMSSGLGAGKAAPIFGIVASTPYGFSVGPLDIGVGVELGMYDFSDAIDYKGFIALATLNSAVYNTPAGAVSAEVGGGYYGTSLGGTAGASFSYIIPNTPVVLNPYVRANVSLSSGDNEIGTVAWINAGIYVKMDISALF